MSSAVTASLSPQLSAQWLAVQVRSGREQFSGEGLRQRGYEVFVPLYRERRRWSDRVKTIERALFPGYLFCRLRGDESARIVTTPGVVRIVGDGFRPIAVPSDEVETIQRVLATRLQVQPYPFMGVGQRVRIIAGPLAGAEGIVLRVKGGHRLVVDVPLLQRSCAVEIQSAWVSASAAGVVDTPPHRS